MMTGKLQKGIMFNDLSVKASRSKHLFGFIYFKLTAYSGSLNLFIYLFLLDTTY